MHTSSSKYSGKAYKPIATSESGSLSITLDINPSMMSIIWGGHDDD